MFSLLKSCKEYGLKDQMLRASVSIASNIAEGSERNSSAEFRRFLFIAKGSAAELRTQVYIAGSIGVFEADVCQRLAAELKEVSKMLQGLANSLSTSRSVGRKEQ
jgi:four helix bundle protein